MNICSYVHDVNKFLKICSWVSFLMFSNFIIRYNDYGNASVDYHNPEQYINSRSNIMKVVSVMKVRKSLGEILNEVNLKSEIFILERAGKPIARLGPLKDEDYTNSMNLRIKSLQNLKGLNPKTPRSKNPDNWLDKERGNWN